MDIRWSTPPKLTGVPRVHAKKAPARKAGTASPVAMQQVRVRPRGGHSGPPDAQSVAGCFGMATPFVFHFTTTKVRGVVPVFLIPWMSHGAV